MRLLILGGFVVLSQVISFPLYAAESAWIKDSTKGCQIWGPNPKLSPNLSFTWSGSCVDGKADGVGIIAWYVHGIPRQTDTYTAENGLTIIAGNVTYNVTQNDVQFEIMDCRSTGSYREVLAFVKDGLALWRTQISTPILNMAGEFAQTRCRKEDGFHNVNVSVYYKKHQSEVSLSKFRIVPEHRQIHAGYTKTNGWGLYENPSKAKRDFDEPQVKQYNALLSEAQKRIENIKKGGQEQNEREMKESATRIGPEMEKEFNLAIKKYASEKLPSEVYAKQVFKYKNKRMGERGLIHVDSFKKNDGQKRSMFGVDYYNMEYEAVVSFPRGTNALCMKWSEGGFYQCMFGNENVSPSGKPVRVTGVISFEKTENGWRPDK